MEDQPEWWKWPLRLTHHLEERMIERGFSEVEVRSMMLPADAVLPDQDSGRFLVDARHLGARWRLVVEPDAATRQIIVITGWRRS